MVYHGRVRQTVFDTLQLSTPLQVNRELRLMLEGVGSVCTPWSVVGKNLS